jgi:(4S)-4-hydroxy-5-phosphonooxypentane-2,3-dione isomerase
MIILLVQVHVNAGAEAAFTTATGENARASRLEPGVTQFDLVQQQDDATRFVIIEVYRDAQAVLDHKSTQHYLHWRDTVASLMAEPRVGVTHRSVSPPDADWLARAGR